MLAYDLDSPTYGYLIGTTYLLQAWLERSK